MSDEYIRKADAVDAVNHALDRETLLFSFVRKVAISALKRLLAADVAPVVHGRWIHDGHHRRCDKCGTYFCNTDREGDTIPDNFCPHCGARMDEGKE